MSFLTPAVTAWLSAHRGTVPTTALARLGITADELRRLVRKRVLERVVHGAYRFTGSPADVFQRAAAICAARPQFVVARETAARIWGIPGFEDVDDVHVLAPHGTHVRRPPPWLHVHRTDVLPAEDIVRRPDGIVVASPPRAVVDLGQVLARDELGLCVEWALSRGRCTETGLRRVAARLDAPKRAWVRRFLAVLDARLPGGPRESRWEQRVLEALRRRGITDLTSQVRDRLPGYGAARFDLAIEAIRYVLEVDVHPGHRTNKGQSSDFRRDRSARRKGWLTDRVGEHALAGAFEATMDEIAESIAARRAEVSSLQRVGLWVA
jgi:very-short-patch-repair endonuclease